MSLNGRQVSLRCTHLCTRFLTNYPQQIKNIINSARIVAKDVGEILSASHVDWVLEVTRRTAGKEAKTNGFAPNGL